MTTWAGVASPWGGTSPPIYGLGACWSPDLGLLVAAGTDQTTNIPGLVSSDGATWVPTGPTLGTNGHWDDVAWSPSLGLLVAVGGDDTGVNSIWTSPDGFAWTGRGNPCGSVYGTVCWSPDLSLFVAGFAVGSSAIATSPDGVTWTVRTSPLTDVNCVAWSPTLGIFAAGGSGAGNALMTSPDGVTWTAVIFTPFTGFQVTAMGWSPTLSLFICGAAQLLTGYPDPCLATSPDGATWTQVSSPFDPLSGPGPTSVVDAAGTIFVTGSSPYIIESSDASTWMPDFDIPFTGASGIAYSPTLRLLVAVGYGPTYAIAEPTTLIPPFPAGSVPFFHHHYSGV